MKDFILNMSNSYKYYKNSYKQLIEENNRLNQELEKYKKIYPPKECPICGYKGIEFKHYVNIIHREVECPQCKSHERHRALWLFFHERTDLLKKGNTFLHFAPEIQFNELFRNSGMEYHPVDISMQNSLVEEKVDIQDIPYEDNYFDLIYCSNILEHVEDDKKGMNELYRVLKPGGTALILVPINGISYEMPVDKTKTFEDKKYNTPELREKYYGQFDHLRLYGTDFKDKLIDVGFKVIADDYIKNLGYEKIDKYALIKDENIFECTK
ncbi:class I SAM-dependent methyltransferase [Methanobrevibacter sp.]|uniref:class I SAM-dependent methyltransferase n=1 Tax=Methanobrevibacter sp. TaxID=66852 RepID=UPI00388EB3F5